MDRRDLAIISGDGLEHRKATEMVGISRARHRPLDCPHPAGLPLQAVATYVHVDMRGRHDGWRWENVPIPQSHVIALGLGLYLRRRHPWDIPAQGLHWRVLGWVLVASAGVIAVSSVMVAGRIRMDRPERLIEDGPYAYSRNPMYLAWTLLYLGITIIVRSMWLLLALPGVILVTHRVVSHEEDVLSERFGKAYHEYTDRVPRYLSLRRPR